MVNHAELQRLIHQIVGKSLDNLNLACEMIMFSFSDYELHAQCFTRIIRDNSILATTLDYQNWDGEYEENNDEWYSVRKYKNQIIGGIVDSVDVNSICDVTIKMNNGIRIELFASNGYPHFSEDQEQWVFFRHHDPSHPFITVTSKTVDIASTWHTP